MHYIIYTDLDGTLLDAHSYSYAPASATLAFLKEKRIPVIPCTSKTHIEVSALRHQLGLNTPFIVENGSAIFFEKDYFPLVDQKVSTLNGYSVIVTGKSYEEISVFFNVLKNTFGVVLKGFHDMEPGEIQLLTGLDRSAALQARERFFSEPFVLPDKNFDPNPLIKFAEQQGFRILRGNRFFHLLGKSDKGQAMKLLNRLYGLNRDPSITTIALGDSLNDLEMLQAADIPVLINKPSGKHQQGFDLPGLIRTNAAGPAGWDEAIRRIIPANL